MSAAAEGSGPTAKAIISDESSSTALKDQQKPAVALEEDDEFEDFPVEGWIAPISMLPNFIIRYSQIGRRKTQKCLENRIRTYGRKAGTTMIRARTSPNS